jgi:hypothetical protein
MPAFPPSTLQATTCERKVRVYDLQANTESHIPESETLISMSASRDGRFLLVNLASNRQHLWDLGGSPGELRVPALPCATYKGASVSAAGLVPVLAALAGRRWAALEDCRHQFACLPACRPAPFVDLSCADCHAHSRLAAGSLSAAAP